MGTSSFPSGLQPEHRSIYFSVMPAFAGMTAFGCVVAAHLKRLKQCREIASSPALFIRGSTNGVR
jgi:hypothetical protein